MKGFVETTIPQRQFENMKIRYEFSNTDEKEQAIEEAQKDCLRLHHSVKDKAAETTIKTIDGKPHRYSRSRGTWVEIPFKSPED